MSCWKHSDGWNVSWDNTEARSLDCIIYPEPLQVDIKTYEKSNRVKGGMTKYWTQVSLFIIFISNLIKPVPQRKQWRHCCWWPMAHDCICSKKKMCKTWIPSHELTPPPSYEAQSLFITHSGKSTKLLSNKSLKHWKKKLRKWDMNIAGCTVCNFKSVHTCVFLKKENILLCGCIDHHSCHTLF